MRLSNIEVKKINRNNILKHMLKVEATSKSSIAEALRLSFPTVTQGLNDLEEIGLVKKGEMLESSGGRKAQSYTCIKDFKVAIGIDITENHINIVMINLAKQVMYTKGKRMRLYDNKASYENLRIEIHEAIEESGISQDKILGLGISLPAIINETDYKIYGMNEEMDISYRLHDIVSDWFTFPVILGNDANSGGKAEIRFGKADKDVVYLYVSQSVGGAIIIDGKVFYGQNQRGGEVGHMTLIPDGKSCYCGREGCVNAYCSTKNLSELTNGDLDEFFRRLKRKEKRCSDIWEEYLDHLALTIHNLNMVFDSDIIIGGYLGQHIGSYMDKLEKRIYKMDPYLEGSNFLKASSLRYDASAIGIASIFTDKYIGQI